MGMKSFKVLARRWREKVGKDDPISFLIHFIRVYPFCILPMPGPHVPHGGPEPDTPVVMVTSVTPDKKVKGKEKGTVDVTFDVVAAVDPSSDEVQGNNLWVLTVFMSKKKTGKGPRLGEVPQALSRAQQSQTIQNGKKIPFRVR